MLNEYWMKIFDHHFSGNPPHEKAVLHKGLLQASVLKWILLEKNILNDSDSPIFGFFLVDGTVSTKKKYVHVFGRAEILSEGMVLLSCLHELVEMN